MPQQQEQQQASQYGRTTNDKSITTPRKPTRIAPKHEAVFEPHQPQVGGDDIAAATTTTTTIPGANSSSKIGVTTSRQQQPTDKTYNTAATSGGGRGMIGVVTPSQPGVTAKSGQSNTSTRNNNNKTDVSEGAMATTPNSTGGNSSKGSHHNTTSTVSRSPSSSLKANRAISKRTSKGSSLTTNNSSLTKKGVSSPIVGVSPSSMSGGSGGGGGSNGVGGATVGATTSGTTTNGPSHTKLCRDRLNNMFDRLKHTLPPPPPGVEVKHKAQVLDYAIMVFKGMVERTAQLEVELAVSSNKATMEWISKLVQQTETFPEAAKRVMRLFIVRRGWLHAELWTSSKRPSNKMSTSSTFCDMSNNNNNNNTATNNTDNDGGVLLSFCDAVGNDNAPPAAHEALSMFSQESKAFHFRANEGVQGRVWSSMRPEWVTGLSDIRYFRRTELARKYGLKVCLAVPITITGKIEGIMCFYDVRHRPYDTQCLELAMRLAWALGNAIGGKRAKVNVLSTSGTSDC